MKRLLAISLLVIFFIPDISRVYLLIDFKINQDSIAKELCLERELEITTCFGKCYLTKQLQKTEEDHNKQLPKSFQQKFENNLICEDLYPSFLPHANLIHQKEEKILFSYSAGHSSSHLSQIFRPPRSLS
jgi:hypothetical protein